MHFYCAYLLLIGTILHHATLCFPFNAGIHKETILDEMELRRLLVDACDNRATHTLPIGKLVVVLVVWYSVLLCFMVVFDEKRHCVSFFGI